MTHQNPFDPELHGGVQFHHPEISDVQERAAKVRFRIKGEKHGPIYQGSQLYQPCIGCGHAPQPPFVSRKPKKFRIHEARSERAIVIPWLSTAAVWSELKYCLRAIESFWSDRECPIYVIGDAAPEWFQPGGRVQHIVIPEYQQSKEAGLYEAFQLGMQIAREVAWFNDDIYLLRPTGFEDLRVALTEGSLMHIAAELRASSTVWRKALGEAVAELKLRGHDEVMRFATHTPFLFEREKSQEIFREFFLHHKGSWVTLYHNFHRTPHTPAGPHKVLSLPTGSRVARFLNHRHAGPDPRTRRELEKMLDAAAPWEL
ncbi:MAG: hypothetical protein V4819_19145 [Verrucomicrobiota bacterium]